MNSPAPTSAPPKLRKKIRLGDLLVENAIITEAQLQAALNDQKKSGRRLGQILVDNGDIDEPSLLQFLSRQLDIPYVDLRHHKYDPDVIRLIPEIHARRYRALALEVQGAEVLVGMVDPTDIFAYDELARILKRPIKTAVVSGGELLRTFDAVYRRTEEISSFADAPVVKLLQTLFEDAIQINASDVHIEPDENVLRIRQRVDGVLNEHVVEEKRIARALVLRLKLMGDLDISEKRLPQDGRFSIQVKDRNIDVRLATMPVQYGESVVMRLLDQTQGLLDLDQLGMPEDIRARFERLISRPHGMVLVTGPTGSGKTTTLYAAIQQLNDAERKIITVEDPVEYRMPRVNQVQVNADIGLTFARVLRSALRHDPDVVLVGEMRDEETAEIGLRAAMTGHMVLSTLHTNDAQSTVSRLLDMGAEGYLIASSLRAVLAQRLVRRVCDSCAEPDALAPEALAWVQAVGGIALSNAQYKRGRGCSHCNNTGYSGRVGVYELLEIDGPLAQALAQNDTAGFARLVNEHPGHQTLVQVALDAAASGVTSIEEVQRIAVDVEPAEPKWEAPDATASLPSSSHAEEQRN